MKYTVEFNGILNEQFQIFPTRRPNIPCPVYDLEEVKIPGRDGILHIDNRRYKPITIPIEFNYIGAADMWASTWRTVKKWLSARNTTLKFSDDSDYFYNVYNVVLDENERVTKRIGRFTANFVCNPYVYLDSGAISMGMDKTALCLATSDGHYLTTSSGTLLQTSYWSTSIVNSLDICHPTYEIVGNGKCEMLINGHEIKTTVRERLIIDTDLQAAYRMDGEKVNQTISGRYPDMWLQPGENVIIMQNAFDLFIRPNWREI